MSNLYQEGVFVLAYGAFGIDLRETQNRQKPVFLNIKLKTLGKFVKRIDIKLMHFANSIPSYYWVE